jgi:hypothetical protein
LTHTSDRTAEWSAGGSLTEAVGGIAVIALAITALTGRFTFGPELVGIATIVIGAGMLLEGGSLAARYARMLAGASLHTSGADLGGGLTTEFAGGAAGIILGILVLLNIAPFALLPISAIVFGAAILLGAGSMASLNNMTVESHFPGAGHAATRRVASAFISSATGTMVLVGIASTVLGIIGVASGNAGLALVLTAVAWLCLGASMIVTGCAAGTRMLSMIHHEQRTTL